MGPCAGECARVVCWVPEAPTWTQRNRLSIKTCTPPRAWSSELQHGQVRCHIMDHNRVGPGEAGVPVTIQALTPTLLLVSRDAMPKLGFGSTGHRTVGEALLSKREHAHVIHLSIQCAHTYPIVFRRREGRRAALRPHLAWRPSGLRQGWKGHRPRVH